MNLRAFIGAVSLFALMVSAGRASAHPTRVYAPAAILSGGAQLEKGADYLKVSGPAKIQWRVVLPAEAQYSIAVVYSAKAPSAAASLGRYTLTVRSVRQEAAIAAQAGVFEESELNFDRVALPRRVHLKAGSQLVTLQMMPKGNEVRVRALEFSREADVREETRARATRADTGWLANAGYGVMFHWTDQSAPQHGAAVPYEVAVDRFDVTRFADLVAVTGAGYVIFSVNHVHPHCPAPLRSWEQVHPGWTTRRDLLGEIARALARIHVPLMLYMSSPVMGRLAAVDAREYLDIHRRILSEMGERYGSLVSGYWLDGWYQGQQEFPGLSLHDLQSAVRAGNPERLVAYNSWVYPVEIPWQDYWAGEVGSLVRLPTQRFPASGAARGLQTHMLMYMDAPWVHSAQNTQMESPRFDDDALITFVRASVASHAAVTLNLGVFQDGTVGDKTLAQVVHLRQAIRGH